jgi:putative flavoprotein involved in K+ transport
MEHTSPADPSEAEAMTREGASEHFDVAVVGAGQSGLVMGRSLASRGRRLVILEADDRIGAAWRTRWDSLTLFTPRRYSALAGLAFPGDPDGYPTRDDVLAYLEEYAAMFDLPVELSSSVRSLSVEDGRFVLEVQGRRVEADQVVVATGAFQIPDVPPVASSLAPEVFQTHSTGYRKPGDVPPGSVLVVGGGNTGYQIAAELSATHRVTLAVGSRQKPLPQSVLGRDLFWWLTKTGLIKKTVESRIGRRLRERDTLIGSSPKDLEKRYGVDVKPRAVSASGRTVSFADGSELDVDAVIWATGYRSDFAWIEAPVFDEGGRVLHRRGVTDVPGLYFLGLSWQHTRGSALIGWVKDDAEFIAAQIDAFNHERRASTDSDDSAMPALDAHEGA